MTTTFTPAGDRKKKTLGRILLFIGVLGLVTILALNKEVLVVLAPPPPARPPAAATAGGGAVLLEEEEAPPAAAQRQQEYSSSSSQIPDLSFLQEACQKHEEHDHQLMNKLSSVSEDIEQIKKSLVDLVVVAQPAVEESSASTSTTSTKTSAATAAPHAETASNMLAPFPMPIKGDKFEIFQPLYHMEESKKNPILFASPHDFLVTFEERITWVDNLVTKNEIKGVKSVKDHAILMYLEMMKSFVSATCFNRAELSVHPRLRQKLVTTMPFNKDTRSKGDDWTYAGDTMTGWDRIDNVYNLLKDVIENDIKGDYIETGVWRGGSSVFAKAVLSVLEPPAGTTTTTTTSTRLSYVCDSFQGLPPGDRSLDKGDQNWDNTPYLEVSSDTVANNFIKYNLLDSNVIFAKGFFNETMPVLSKHIQKLSVMRLDGDMYESTVDVLYNLYDKLSIGGYVIMDDWFGFPSKTACEDFFKVHGINPEIVPIDNLSAYWKKTEDVKIQFWRYEQSKFKFTQGEDV